MRFPFLMTVVLVFAAGCGNTKVVPVSGRVTLANKPLAHATILFQPLSEDKNPGPGSSAKTDANGQFTLELMTGERKGAIVGEHKVSIVAYEGDGAVPSSGSDMVFRKALIPDEYNAASKLTFTVPPGGTTKADFDLPSFDVK